MNKTISGDTAYRVNYVVRFILSAKQTTRSFDNCFEMGDADDVLRGVYKRALKNEKLMAALPKYLNLDSIRSVQNES